MTTLAFKFRGIFVSVSAAPPNAMLRAIAEAARGALWGICPVSGAPARFDAAGRADSGSTAAARRAVCAQSLALYGVPYGTRDEIAAALAVTPIYAGAQRAEAEAYAAGRGWRVSLRYIWSRGFCLLDGAPVYIAHPGVLPDYDAEGAGRGGLFDPETMGSAADYALARRQVEAETALLIAQMMQIEEQDRAALMRAYTDTQAHLDSILRTRAWKLIGAYYRMRTGRAPQPAPPPAFSRSAPPAAPPAEPLEGAGDAPEIVIGAPSGKTALIVAPSLPMYDRESGARRLDHLIGLLRALGWSVALRVEALDDAPIYRERLTRAGVDVGAVGAAAPTPDLILFQFWGTAETHAEMLRAAFPDAKVIIDSVDLHFLRELRGGAFDQAVDTFGRELRAYRAADAVLTVSDKEAAWVADMLPGAGVYALPDMETLEPSPLPFGARRGILFLGNFKHTPNRDALDWLLRDIAPRLDPALLEAHPIRVVGHGLHEYAPMHAAAARPGVEMIGAVESVMPYIAAARLMIAPLRVGAGTKRKLIQAALIGTPIITTRIGAEGLPLEPERSALLADDAPSFAAAVARLIDDAPLWEQVRAEARLRVLERHSRDPVLARLRHILAKLGF